MLVIERRERGLVIETKVFRAYDCGILEAIEYILQNGEDLTRKDKLFFIKNLINNLGKEINSSKRVGISYKFYYLP